MVRFDYYYIYIFLYLLFTFLFTLPLSVLGKRHIIQNRKKAIENKKEIYAC